MFCVSFTEILDYVERDMFSMSKPNDFMMVSNQRDCCSAAELKVVNSGKWTFTIILHPAVFQYLSHGKLSSVNHESTLKGAALKVNK